MCQATFITTDQNPVAQPATVGSLRGVLTGGPKLISISVGNKYSHIFLLDVLPTGGQLTLLQANADPSYPASAWLLEARAHTTVDAFLVTFGQYLAARTAGDITRLYNLLFSITGQEVQDHGGSTETATYLEFSYSASSLENLKFAIQQGWFCWKAGTAVSDSDNQLTMSVRVVVVGLSKKFVLPWQSTVANLLAEVAKWPALSDFASTSLVLVTKAKRTPMDGFLPLSEYNICLEGTVFVANKGDLDILVEVANVGGTVDVYRCRVTSTIADLISQIREKIHLTGYNLLWKGQGLRPEQSLLDIGVTAKDARFTMIMTMVGG